MIDYTSYEVEDFVADDYFIAWVLQASPEHAQFWEQWMAQHPARVYTIQQARRIINSLHISAAGGLSAEEADQLIQQVRQRQLQAPQPATFLIKRYNHRRWLAAAAVFAGLLVAALFIRLLINRQPNASQAGTFRNKINNSTHSILISLSDSSSVVLKPGSELYYPTTFHPSTREVWLKGEAFFEVRKNAGKAFLVHTNGMVTRVLGTSFSVRAYEKDSAFKVTVATGKVAVSRDDAAHTGKTVADTVLLLPDQQVTFQRSQARFIRGKNTTPLLLSATQAPKAFTFNETPFYQVINKLEQAYGVTIEYDKEAMNACPLTAFLSNRSLLEKMDLICSAMNCSYTVWEDRIVINGKGCAAIDQ